MPGGLGQGAGALQHGRVHAAEGVEVKQRPQRGRRGSADRRCRIRGAAAEPVQRFLAELSPQGPRHLAVRNAFRAYYLGFKGYGYLNPQALKS